MHDWNRVASKRSADIFRDAEVWRKGAVSVPTEAMGRKDCQTRPLQSAHDISASKEGLDP
jgi:hypothetical protein